MSSYTETMYLIYSKPIIPRVGNKRVSSRVFKGDLLDKSIQLYRMWFLFLRLGLDLEDNNIPIFDHVNKKNTKVRVNKKFYKDWDLEKVKNVKFDDWWKEKKHLFIETSPILTNEIDNVDEYYYIKVDKRLRIEDVVREVRQLLKSKKTHPTSKYIIHKQHKYIPTHMKYNVFIWKNMGKTRTQIINLLESSYKYYDIRSPKDESSIRRVLRSSERLIIDTSKGVF